MSRLVPFLAVVSLSLVLACVSARSRAADAVSVVACPKANFAEKLAAKEIRRYFYLRTGKLLPIEMGLPQGDAFVIGLKDCPVVQGVLDEAMKAKVGQLSAEQYILKTIDRPGGGRAAVVVGGDAVGTLYGAYRLAERLGVRFYMHGDVVPDERISPELPNLDETGKPLFAHRGIQPFHDFPEGPDWWNLDDYKAILGQLPKMRMNFFGLHTYPQGGVGPEPLVWIGRPDEVAADGKVKAAYPSRHFVTTNSPPAWGAATMKTGDYVFGAADLFDRDDYGADYMRGMKPWNQMPDRDNCALFDRMGSVLRDAFTFARQVGIKTCVGTETPLVIPDAVKQRLKAAGKNPADPAVVEEIYEGMFRRIAATHPVDYYWLWTPEGWTWGAVSEGQIRETQSDFHAALAAIAKVKPPFTLATCGWVLGPPQSPALFDDSLPKNMPMSCISRQVGNSPVEPGFARVEGRPKWSIPWMEDDPGMTIPQLWAGRMRRDAADSLAYGCTGLMGIHWRTRILAPNVSALAQAAWDQTGWNPDFGKKQGAAGAVATEGPDGGAVATFPNSTITGTDDPTVYQTVRYNLRGYRLNVPNGTYAVTLKFCEPAYHEKGKRVFGAKVQGRVLVKGLDVFAKVGQNHALDMAIKDVKVADGRLKIDFDYEVEYPCVAAIVVEGRTDAVGQTAARAFSRKINCGGPVYKDYEADPATGGDGRPRYLPAGDFYADWAKAEFGTAASGPIAAIFTRLDGHLPRPADWVTGPGSIRPDGAAWQAVQGQYAFVDELAAIRPRVKGAGNLERFDYWLDNFRYLRAIAKVRCAWGRYEAVMAKVRAEKSAETRKRMAEESALPARKELVAAFSELHAYFLATVTTPGELGNLCNWQQQTMPVLLTVPGTELAGILGAPLPADAEPSKDYAGPPRIIVPTVRTGIAKGESLKLTVILAGITPREAAIHWRPMGQGQFAAVPLVHVARSVYSVTLPGDATKADLEYYVRVVDAKGGVLKWPLGNNQTVTVSE